MMSFTALVRGIADTGAVSREEFIRATSLDADRAFELFSSLAAFGLEFDEQGRIVGAALTTKTPPHAIHIAGKEFFAWCALDKIGRAHV